MTSLMISRCGKQGKVIAVEAQDDLYRGLEALAVTYRPLVNPLNLALIHAALTNRSGTGSIFVPDDWASNRGTAGFLTWGRQGKEQPVQLRMLDELISNTETVGVLKIDVEGHELEVLQGGLKLISEKRARYIIYESHGTSGDAVRKFLEAYGYEVFALTQRFSGLCLEHSSNVINFVATCETDELKRLFPRKAGKCLKANVRSNLSRILFRGLAPILPLHWTTIAKR